MGRGVIETKRREEKGGVGNRKWKSRRWIETKDKERNLKGGR